MDQGKGEITPDGLTSRGACGRSRSRTEPPPTMEGSQIGRALSQRQRKTIAVRRGVRLALRDYATVCGERLSFSKAMGGYVVTVPLLYAHWRIPKELEIDGETVKVVTQVVVSDSPPSSPDGGSRGGDIASSASTSTSSSTVTSDDDGEYETEFDVVHFIDFDTETSFGGSAESTGMPSHPPRRPAERGVASGLAFSVASFRPKHTSYRTRPNEKLRSRPK